MEDAPRSREGVARSDARRTSDARMVSAPVSAELITKLIEAGTPAALVAEVAMVLGRAQADRDALEQRRTHERDRKARSREVTGQNVTERDGAETLSPQSPPLKTPPDPLKNTPPLTPQSEDVSADADRPTPLTKREILEAWHSRMVPLGFPAVAKMTGQRERQLSARLKDSTLEEWQRAMDALERSAFCRGENDRGWRADFDFLLQPKSFTGLLEGKYDH
jgi:hypothetical protein